MIIIDLRAEADAAAEAAVAAQAGFIGPAAFRPAALREGVERRLAAREPRAAATRQIGLILPQVLLGVGIELFVAVDVIGRADRGQEPAQRIDPPLRQIAGQAGQRADHRLHREAAGRPLRAGLEACLDQQPVECLPAVLQVQLELFDLRIALILREQRLRDRERADVRRAVARRVDVDAIPATPLRRAVVFEPAAQFDLVRAEIEVERGDDAPAVDAIFGGAGDQARSARRGDQRGPGRRRLRIGARGAGGREDAVSIGGKAAVAGQGRVRRIEIGLRGGDRLAERPRDDADAVIVVVIGRVGQRDIFGEACLVPAIGKIIGALRIRVIIAVIAAFRRGRVAERAEVIGAIAVEVRVEERLRVRRVELRRAGGFAGRGLEEDRRILVRLRHVVIVEVQRQLAEAVIVDELGVRLPAALNTVEVPGAGPLADARHIGAVGAPAEGAGVDPHEGARRVVAADGLRGLNAERRQRAGRIGFDRAAQIAVRRGGKIARAGRDDDAADVFRNHRALRRQAVVIAVALVAERDAVHRIAELVAGKAMDEDLGVLFVVPPRIGGDVQHAGQRLDCFERADAGQDLLHLGAGQLHRGTRAATGDDDGGGLPGGIRRIVRRGGGRLRLLRTDGDGTDGCDGYGQ